MIACAGSCGCGELLCAIVTGHMQMEALWKPRAGELGSWGAWAFQSISPASTSVPRSYLRASAQRKGFFRKGHDFQMGFSDCSNAEIAAEHLEGPLYPS